MIKSFNSEVECFSEIERLRLLQQQQILRPEVIPQELAKSKQWIVWSYEVTEQIGGIYRVEKHPYQPKNPDNTIIRNRHSDWSDLATAIRCFQENSHIDGIGYLFVEGDGLIGIDLDNCRNPDTSKIREEYLFWIKKFGSYAEISPSGTGVKIWVKGTVSDNYFLSNESSGFRILNFAGGEIEIYRHGQYFAVTTQMINGFDTIRDAQVELDVICEFSASRTQRDFRYSSCPDYQLTELDANRELSLLQGFWNDTGLAYIDESEPKELVPESGDESQESKQISRDEQKWIKDELDFTNKHMLRDPASEPNVVKETVTDTSPFEANLLLKSKKEYFGETRCKNCPGNSYGYELCPRCYAAAHPEEKVEDAVYEYFSKLSKFSVVRQPDYEITLGSKKMIPDVVLLDTKENIIAIAECKREYTIFDGIEQLKSYLSASDTQFGIFANSIEPENWIFYENLRGHRFEENIPRSRFENEIVANRHIKSIREEKNELESKISHLCKRHTRNVSDIEVSNKELNELENHIKNERETHTKLKEDNDKLVKKNADLTIEINKNAKQLEVQESFKLISTRDKLTSQVSKLSTRKDWLEKAIETMLERKKCLSKKISVAFEIVSLNEQKYQLQNEIRVMQQQSANLSEKTKSLRSQKSTFEKEQNKIISDRTKLEKEKDSWLQKLKNKKIELSDIEERIKHRAKPLRDLGRLARLDELEEAFSEGSIYGQLEKELERLQEIESEIVFKQELARDSQEKYAAFERNQVKINQKKQQRVQASQDKERILNQIRRVVTRLRTANPEQKQQIEKHRKQLIGDLKQQKHNCSQILAEISQLEDVKSKLESENRVKEHHFSFTEKDVLPTYLQIEEEIDMLKTEKYKLEAEIGHRVFELIPKKD